MVQLWKGEHVICLLVHMSLLSFSFKYMLCKPKKKRENSIPDNNIKSSNKLFVTSGKIKAIAERK
jgi:hypothetical protein